jgi:periplasmic protein CpxP/Spy
MKMIKTVVMAAAIVASASVVASAQDAQQQGRGAGGRGGMNIVQVLKDSLKISDAVAAKADSIVKDFAAKRAPLMEAARGGDADARTKAQALQTEQTTAIKALLTDEQKTKYDALMAGMRGRRGGF